MLWGQTPWKALLFDGDGKFHLQTMRVALDETRNTFSNNEGPTRAHVMYFARFHWKGRYIQESQQSEAVPISQRAESQAVNHELLCTEVTGDYGTPSISDHPERWCILAWLQHQRQESSLLDADELFEWEQPLSNKRNADTQCGMRPISCWCHALIMHWTWHVFNQYPSVL